MFSQQSSPTKTIKTTQSPNTYGTENSKSLSNDALYAPLLSYENSSNKNRHSLTILTNSTLRESSLLSFLTNMSQQLKTSHPYERLLYRGIGGNLARHGMGDCDRASAGMRNDLESKLSNRSLVLIGGGMHTHSSGGTENETEATSILTIAQGAAASSSGKRIKKRVGGNGIFGSVSQRKRKKILRDRTTLHSKGLTINQKNATTRKELENGLCENFHQPVQKHVSHHIELDSNNFMNVNTTIIEALHSMWIDYITSLLLPTKERTPVLLNNSVDQTDNVQSHNTGITLENRKCLSSLLIDAEHVGMPATIMECPSRRHLVHSRCIVVNESKETWSVAIATKKKGSKPAITTKSVDTFISPSIMWKIIIVPKRGTIMEVKVPWYEHSSNDSVNQCTTPTRNSILIRIET